MKTKGNNVLRPIRNSARAIIINGSQVLLTKNKDFLGEFYMFPGGGQDKGETLSDTVIRECMEEAGVQVIPEDMVCIREYIGSNHEFAQWDRDFHQVEFYFLCKPIMDEAVSITELVPKNPDEDQIGAEWVELGNLKNIRIYPKTLAHLLRDHGVDGLPSFYIGDVN
jgi:8-oxo-dGTP diphosphatase